MYLRRSTRKGRELSLGMIGTGVLALAASTLIALIVLVVLKEAAPALAEVGLWRFVSDPDWHPSSDEYNLTPMVAGTFLVALGALLLAIPLGLIVAIFVSFYAPPAVGTAYLRLIELFAGIPSGLYGLWGLIVLVPLIAEIKSPGSSLLAAVLVLALMVLPTIALISTMSLRAVPLDRIQAARALGFTKSSTIFKIVIPSARKGLAVAGVLGAGRAVGETMAVMMVAGNIVQVPESVFEPVRTLSANIALEIAYAMDIHRSALFVSALVMIVFVLLATALLEVLTGGKAMADGQPE
jgi:phosphate transport system permease protein